MVIAQTALHQVQIPLWNHCFMSETDIPHLYGTFLLMYALPAKTSLPLPLYTDNPATYNFELPPVPI